MGKHSIRMRWVFTLSIPVMIITGCGMGKSHTGIVNGRLRDCPPSPNCISTAAKPDDTQHYMPPVSFKGTPEEAHRIILQVLKEYPRTSIVADSGYYIHAACTTAVFRFVDDVEFLIDAENKQIHFRSASRLGRSDLGVNRKRMEEITSEIRKKLDQAE